MQQIVTRDKRGLWSISLILGLAALLLYVTFNLTKYTQNRSLASHASFYVDMSGTFTVNDLQQLQEKAWQTVPQTMSFGITSESHWIRVALPHNESHRQQILELNYALLDNVEIWFFEEARLASNALAQYKSGDRYLYEERPIAHDKLLFTVPNSSADQITAYLRVQSTGPLKAEVNLWTKEEYISYISAHRLFMGIFFGYMIAMCLSNLFLFASTRINAFIVYSAYVLVFALVIASLQGLSFRFLWPNNIWLQERSVAIFSYVMMGLIVYFTRLILELDKERPKFSNGLKMLQILYFLLAGIALIFSYSLMIKVLLVMLLVSIPLILFVSITMALQGSQIARFFSAAWGVLLLSGIMTSADSFQWLNFPIDASYVLMIGATIETLLLALALALSFDNQQYRARQAKKQILESEKAATAAKDELLVLQIQAQEQLEYAVDERTLELEIALRELSEVNNELEALSSIDALTSLMNRRAFEKRILAESRRSRRERTPLALAMLDIDFFKKVNDTYGHQAGDECLRIFSALLKDTVKRPSDVICRYGGEEFVIILPNTTLDGAKILMEQVRAAVESATIEFENHQIRMTTSIGLTSRVVSSDSDHELMVSYADKQLYNAKENGRNKVMAATF